MAKSNMALPVVCVVLGLHIVASLYLKSKLLNDIRKTNKAVREDDQSILPDDFSFNKVKGSQVNNPIADVVLLVVAGLCLLKCCSGKPKPEAMKGVCVVTAVLMLIRSFPELLEGYSGAANNEKVYIRRLVYGITALVNALVAVACCC